jgi:hypothetical protein
MPHKTSTIIEIFKSQKVQAKFPLTQGYPQTIPMAALSSMGISRRLVISKVTGLSVGQLWLKEPLLSQRIFGTRTESRGLVNILSFAEIPEVGDNHDDKHQPNIQGISRPFVPRKIGVCTSRIFHQPVDISDSDEQTAEIEIPQPDSHIHALVNDLPSAAGTGTQSDVEKNGNQGKYSKEEHLQAETSENYRFGQVELGLRLGTEQDNDADGLNKKAKDIARDENRGDPVYADEG